MIVIRRPVASTRTARHAEGLVAHVAKCAGVSRQQISSAEKAQESHAANGDVERATTAFGVGNERTWVQPNSACFLIYGVDARPTVGVGCN